MPKISQLISATLPIVGNEVVIINQNGTTYSSLLSNFIGGGSNVSTLSANWENTYTAFQANSANYALIDGVNIFTENQSIYGNLSANTINIGSMIINEPLDDRQLLIGNEAGIGATNASDSNFLGNYAGGYSTNASNSNFFGNSAGAGAVEANNSNFFGLNAGSGATDANNSNFFGSNAGLLATNASSSNFLGHNAGNGATDADNSNFLGSESGSGVTGSKNQLIGSNTSVLPLSCSGCIVLGDYAVATQSNTLAMGSTTTPLLTAGSGTTTGNYLVVRLNGQNVKLLLYV